MVTVYELINHIHAYIHIRKKASKLCEETGFTLYVRGHLPRLLSRQGQVFAINHLGARVRRNSYSKYEEYESDHGRFEIH